MSYAPPPSKHRKLGRHGNRALLYSAQRIELPPREVFLPPAYAKDGRIIRYADSIIVRRFKTIFHARLAH